MEFARFDLVFVPYSHYDETKTLLYPITSICLTNADGKQFILFQTPIYGGLIFLIIIMFLVGQFIFAKRAASLGSIEPDKYGSMFRLLNGRTGSRGLAMSGNILTVFTYAVLLIIEIILGASILSYAIPSVAEYQLLAVAIITAGVCAYVALGGFQLVVMSDRWQFLFLIIGVAAAFILISFSLIDSGVNMLESLNVFLVIPEGGLLVTGTFVLNVVIVNTLLPSCQSASWQRFSASSSTDEFTEGYRRSIVKELSWAWVAFAFLAALFYYANGKQIGGPADLFSFIDGIGAIGSLFVGPLLFAGLVAAIVSTADSLLIAMLLSIDDFFDERQRQDVKKSRKRLYLSSVVAFILVVVGYVAFTSIGDNQRSVFIGLMFTGVGQIVLLAPLVWYALSDKPTKRRINPKVAVTGLTIGFVVLWALSLQGIATGNIVFNHISPVAGLLVVWVFTTLAQSKTAPA